MTNSLALRPLYCGASLALLLVGCLADINRVGQIEDISGSGGNTATAGATGTGGALATGGKSGIGGAIDSCTTGSLGCACYTSGACASGLACDANKMCMATTTTGGASGVGGSGPTSTFVDNCTIGTLNCNCYTSGACAAGLACSANNMCVLTSATGGASGVGGSGPTSTFVDNCTIGTLNCNCYTSGACAVGLICSSAGTCISESGVGGASGVGGTAASGGTGGISSSVDPDADEYTQVCDSEACCVPLALSNAHVNVYNMNGVMSLDITLERTDANKATSYWDYALTAVTSNGGKYEVPLFVSPTALAPSTRFEILTFSGDMLPPPQGCGSSVEVQIRLRSSSYSNSDKSNVVCQSSGLSTPLTFTRPVQCPVCPSEKELLPNGRCDIPGTEFCYYEAPLMGGGTGRLPCRCDIDNSGAKIWSCAVT